MRSSSHTKRKRQQDQSEGSPSSPDEGEEPQDETSSLLYTSFRQWLDDGTTNEDGTTDHEFLEVSVGNEIHELSLGDSVWLRMSEKEDSVLHNRHDDDDDTAKGSESSQRMARIERMWEEPERKPTTRRRWRQEMNSSSETTLKIRARWFLQVRCYFVAPWTFHLLSRTLVHLHHTVRPCQT